MKRIRADRAFTGAERAARWREAHHEKFTEGKRSSWAKMRIRALMHLGGKCVDCGEDDLIVLQLDHKDGDGYKDRQKGHRRDGPSSALREPERFEVRCANCHVRKTRASGDYISVRWRNGDYKPPEIPEDKQIKLALDTQIVTPKSPIALYAMPIPLYATTNPGSRSIARP